MLMKGMCCFFKVRINVERCASTFKSRYVLLIIFMMILVFEFFCVLRLSFLIECVMYFDVGLI